MQNLRITFATVFSKMRVLRLRGNRQAISQNRTMSITAPFSCEKAQGCENGLALVGHDRS